MPYSRPTPNRKMGEGRAEEEGEEKKEGGKERFLF
jgi:hypothetical protein